MGAKRRPSPACGAKSEPGYLELYRIGELKRRVEAAQAALESCELCPHRCRADRLAGEQGFCRMGRSPKVASWNVHRWEEPPISGTRGSGTIFFSGCTARCRFCQNFPISQLRYGALVTAERLAGMMLELQRKGAHNINFVTPTHFVPQILAALLHAVRAGLHLPLIYNTSGYERETTLQLLDGIIDIWLPDAKYANDDTARRLSGFQSYVPNNRVALREMYRQVGHELTLDSDGIAVRGMIVRHMVLPDGLAGTPQVLEWIARELSPEVHVSLMDQYFPAHHALDDPILGRKVTSDEYVAALQVFETAGLQRGWFQNTTEECDLP